MPITCYVLEDDALAHPEDVSMGGDGVLRHKDGRAVAYAPHGPRTRSVDDKDLPRRRKAVEPEQSEPAKDTREMKPTAPKRRYKTR